MKERAVRNRVPFEQELEGEMCVRVVANPLEGIRLWLQLERESRDGERGLEVEEHSVCFHE